MNILDIYQQYKIMPALQLHQFRVAAVGKLICDNLNIPVDSESITRALLLHDMGNIIKFKLGVFPEFCEPEGIEYWEGVKSEFILNYGNNEHEATYKIAQEINVENKVLELINAVGFSKAVENFDSGDIEKMIVNYADQRVLPHRIGSLHDRFEDGHKRFYLKTTRSDSDYELGVEALMNMERLIFSKSNIYSEDIDDDSVATIIDIMKTYKI
jgi:hypothetical protein